MIYSRSIQVHTTAAVFANGNFALDQIILTNCMKCLFEKFLIFKMRFSIYLISIYIYFLTGNINYLAIIKSIKILDTYKIIIS